jgi:hypothetical protein
MKTIRLNLENSDAETLVKLTDSKNLHTFSSFLSVSELIYLEKLNQTLTEKLAKDEIGIKDEKVSIVYN